MSVQQEYSEMEAKSSSMDRINNIPSGILEDIICHLPTKDAVRTSILSKKWRYGWVIVPKLVFNEEDMFDKTNFSRQPPNERRELARKFKRKLLAIYQVLLRHQGPIREFGLSINSDFLLHYDPSCPGSRGSDTCAEIDQIITHLAKNNNIVEKFTLDLGYYSTYRPPLSIFSLHQLRDLYIKSCNFNYDPTFSGFGSLTSLRLGTQRTSKKALLHLLSNCPVLKSVTLEIGLDNIDEEFTVAELLNCLPVMEHLSINCYNIRCSAQDRVPRVLPTSLLNLKHICLQMMGLVADYGLLLIGLMMRSSPNLETFKIYITSENYHHDDDILTMEDCSDIRLEHLKELEFNNFAECIGEMEFVKLMLAKSPILKKARIILNRKVTKDEGSRMCKMLLDSPRASQMADIIVEHFHKEEN